MHDHDVAVSNVLARDDRLAVPVLATLTAALGETPTRGRRFEGRGRGGDLRAHDTWVETCLSQTQHLLDVQALRKLWSRLRTTPWNAPEGRSLWSYTPIRVNP